MNIVRATGLSLTYFLCFLVSHSTLAERSTWTEQKSNYHAQLEGDKLTRSERITLLQHAGVTAIEQRALNDAAEFYKQLISLLNADSDAAQFYLSHKYLASVYIGLGLYQEAESPYKVALHYYQTQKNHLEVANIHNNLGVLYNEMNDALESLNHFSKAKFYFEQYGTAQDKADIKLNLSGVYVQAGYYEAALNLLPSQIDEFKSLGDEHGVAAVQGLLAVVYLRTGQYSEARVAINDAKAYHEKMGLDVSLATDYFVLAEVSFAEGRIEQATQEVEAGLRHANLSHNMKSQAELYSVEGRIYFAQGQFAKAKSKLQRSLEIAKEIGLSDVKFTALQYLALIKAYEGQLKEAATTLDHAIKIHGTFSNELMFSKLADYSVKYEASKLTQEISDLKQQKQVQALEAQKLEHQYSMGGLILCLLIFLISTWLYRVSEKQTKQLLQQQVDEKTKELQLIADDLREASQIKSQFLANISHEIRTPLTSIIGQTDHLIADHQHAPSVNESLEVIRRQGQHLKALISDVLDLSKLEAQRLQLEFTEFSIAQLLGDIECMFTYSFKQKGLRFEITHQLAPRFSIRSDYVRLKQIIINLLSNALKFTQEGHVILNVEVVANMLQFSVRDTGIGMREAQLEKVFEQFQQADNSITRHFGGTGLGLSLSRQLAQMFDGEIKVSSEYGKGSEFILTIPFQQVKLQNPPLQKCQTVKLECSASFDGHIVIAEDHPDNRTLFVRLFKQLGMEVDEAANGIEAVEQCLSLFPDIVFMDIQMPKMGGVEALSILREAGFDGPVYALTANVIEHEIHTYLEAGFTGHLGKPIDKEKLHAVLSLHLGEKSSHQSDNEVIFDASDLKRNFIASLNDEKEQLVLLWEQQNYAALGALCHKLVGASLTFELDELAACARQFEKSLQANKQSQYSEFYAALYRALQEYELEQLDIT